MEGSRAGLRLGRVFGVLAFGVLLLGAGEARAEPQGTAGLTIGVAGRGFDRRIWDQTVFHLGLRGDVLFGRSKVTDFGFGPYAEVATHAFDEVQLGAGFSTLFPVLQALPIVASVGGYGRYAPLQGVEPGVAGALFWGSRSYNFHANYVMAAGLLAQFRYGLGPSRETSIVVSAQLDLVALSLPFQILVNAFRGSPATRPVK
ncbi:hypothetical protein [Polyangium spumosum]|uniref:Outer membrane beta-barrel protein n=1 Tax=Polyangium spumosum TaxID=889282 RepID=A0A6N7PRG2_9BACT|nr:hypothetical protein [Polyangium spumosum]MRG94573.1 hypothetical protein [Polyangium spumosum]